MKFPFLVILFAAATQTLSAQSVGVGTTTPHSSALLHLQSTDQGVLIPRMLRTQRDAIPMPAHGLLVYQSDDTPGFYFNQGTQNTPDWVKIGGENDADFNDGGEPGGKDRSLGNHDFYDLSILTDNTPRMHVENTGNVGLGTETPQEQLEITGNFRLPPSTDSSGVIKMGADNFAHSFGTNNAFVGIAAGNLTSTGADNTGVGESTMTSLTDGARNTALGAYALQSLSSGNDNVAVGRSALLFGNGDNNTAVGASALTSNQGNDNVALGSSALAGSNANYNTAIGTFTLASNILGSHNTALGYNADVGSPSLTNSTVIGANAMVAASNSLVLGGTGAYAVNVGIGTNTPVEILDIVEDPTGNATIISHKNAATASPSNLVRLIHKLNTDLQSRTAFRIETSFSNTTDATRKSRVTFSTASPDLLPAMTFSGEDIGIGVVPALAADFHISRSEGDAILRLEANADNNDAFDQPRLQFYQSGGAQTAFVGFSNGDANLRLMNQSAGDLYLGTSNSVDMMIDNSTTRVGIGNTSPEAQLHVEAELGISFLVDDQINDTSPFIIRDNGDVGVGLFVPDAKMHIIGSSLQDPALLVEGVSTGTQDIFLFENGAGTERLRLQCDGDLFLNGSQIHSSDLRLKKNIETISDPLEKVMHLRGVNFDWRQDVDGPRSTNRTMGFIAQEVEAVIPHLVQENKSGYKAVAYANITALLVEALKSQQYEITALRKMVEELVVDVASK